MGKKLKICLAMGGGVSLGTFSGAALTEALKLLVLHGKDTKGDAYESVEVDGMSGASAGSIALAIMMRCLIDYRSLLPKLIDKEITGDESYSENEIEERIIKTYNIDRTNPKFEIIKALEVTQIVQKLIWVNTLDTNKLFNVNEENKFGEPFGILSRNDAINAAKKVLLDDINGINIENRQLITDQALMAFTMANLSPIAYGEKSASNTKNKQDEDIKKIPNLVKILQTSTNINNHNEARIFDLHFRESLAVDTRYITIPTSLNDENLNKKRALNDKDTWAEILASAVASGAFPLGFPPAIITKYKEEYSENEWPKDENINYLNFAYVDGGTFNNEPIKEAFKLGAYIDFQNSDPHFRLQEDRLILFVDPSVPGDAQVRQLKSLDPIKEIDDLKFDVKQTPTKMINVTLDLLSSVASQAEINEEGKVNEFYLKSILNEYLFDYFKNLKSLDLEIVLNSEFLISTYKNLSWSLKSRQISVGTREVSEFLFWKYKKLCGRKQQGQCLIKDDFELIYGQVNEFVEGKIMVDQAINKIEEIIKDANCDVNSEKVNIGSCLFLAIAELGLNQFGKDVKAERAGIFPIQGKHGDFKVENLPGHEISRFAGFASRDAREACFAKGRLDALKCLSSNDFREYHYHTMLNKNKNSNTIKSYIIGHELTKISEIFESEFKSHFNKWELSFKADMENNMRTKIVDRVYNVITSINSENGLSLPKIIGYGWKYLVNKNKLIKKLVNEKVMSEATMQTLTEKTKNIAIKFRYEGNMMSTVFQLTETSESVRPYYQKDQDNFLYFKCYLVIVPKLMHNEEKVTEYCYLSLSEYVDNKILRELVKIDESSDKNKILSIKSTNTNPHINFNLASSDILAFIEENYQWLKYNINPVIEIKSNTMTVKDLSKPLAQVINPGWEPFV